ncbi:MAG: M20 family metallo-hydrolase [Dysgonamonadaceae bacterium]|jgi:acetylornithine deacetylase|nr:M20 family metallo-hydrolase [Dysgonamonadaceae bacterium]
MDPDSLYYDSIDLLKKLIETPSLSRDEAAAADLLEQYMKAQGLIVFRSGNNCWAVASGFKNERPTILLNSHIDTVKPVSGWNKDPFFPTEEDEKIYGLGSNDAGACLVSLLHVFIALNSTEQSYNLIFLASCEEEVSGPGGIESVLPLLPPISFGLIGEPTNMQPAIAEKGLVVLDCVVHGKSGHAARDEGENAIYKALPVIDWFKNYRFPNESPWLGKVKMSVTMIEAGTQHNVVPDCCKFTVDVRTNECYSNPEVVEIIRNGCNCEVKARSFRLNSSSVALDHPVVKRTIMSGKEPFGSPTLSDQALMPFPTLKMGPGLSARSHTADEFIEKSEIREAIEVYFKLFNGLNL